MLNFRIFIDAAPLKVCDGEVDCGKSQTTVVIKDSMGRDHKTTLYNLEVLNKLGMCKLCRDKDKAVVKVSDESSETQHMFSKTHRTSQ